METSPDRDQHGLQRAPFLDRCWTGLYGWVTNRFDLTEVEKFIRKKEVPIHRQHFWYFFGGITLFFFLIQVTTGILLMLYYRPTVEAAFESVQFIMTDVPFGWLIRSIHSWSANLMVASAFVHLFSVFFLKAYRKPRELTWVSGVFLLFLSLAFGFSGYLLPWNELAFFATKVGTEIVAVVPVVGQFFMEFLRGGEDVTGATLTRFFAFHVAVLPTLTVGMLVLHLLFIQKQGMSVPPKLENRMEKLKSIRFFPNFLLRELLGWVLGLVCLAALAAYYPWELGVKADPFAPAPAGITPEWYFVFMFQTLKFIPARIVWFDGEVLGILVFGLLGLALLLVPFIDREAHRGRPARWITIAGIIAIVYILVMTLISYTTSQDF